MPRFYFHLYQRGDMLVDPEGVEITDLSTVRSRALEVARDLIAADAASGLVDLDTRLRVVDESDRLVLDLAFFDAVAFVGGRSLAARDSEFGLSYGP